MNDESDTSATQATSPANALRLQCQSYASELGAFATHFARMMPEGEERLDLEACSNSFQNTSSALAQPKSESEGQWRADVDPDFGRAVPYLLYTASKSFGDPVVNSYFQRLGSAAQRSVQGRACAQTLSDENANAVLEQLDSDFNPVLSQSRQQVWDRVDPWGRYHRLSVPPNDGQDDEDDEAASLQRNNLGDISAVCTEEIEALGNCRLGLSLRGLSKLQKLEAVLPKINASIQSHSHHVKMGYQALNEWTAAAEEVNAEYNGIQVTESDPEEMDDAQSEEAMTGDGGTTSSDHQD